MKQERSNKIHQHADPVSEKFLHLFIHSDPLSDTLRDITPPIMTDSSRRLFKSFLCRLQRSQALLQVQGGNSILFLKLLNIPDLRLLTLHCCLQYQKVIAGNKTPRPAGIEKRNLSRQKLIPSQVPNESWESWVMRLEFQFKYF